MPSHMHRQGVVRTDERIMNVMLWGLRTLKVVCVRFPATLAHDSCMCPLFVYVGECRLIGGNIGASGHACMYIYMYVYIYIYM